MDVIMESYFDGNNPWGWKDTSLDLYKWSGYRLVDEINSQKPRSVLDVGCGYNRFKGKINNLIGIDPYNDLADIKVSLEDYKAGPVDIVLCLGSINFGDENTIDNQMEILDELWYKKAYFRVNPGKEHTWHKKESWEGIVWYDWSRSKIDSIVDKYKYTLDRFEEELTTKGHKRYYFELSKPNI